MASEAPKSRAEYTIGWICALVIEYTAAQEFLDEEFDPPVDNDDGNDGDDNNHYTYGRLGKHNVVIAVLPHGIYRTSSAAVAAANLARSHPNVKAGLMVGIGGGAPSAANDIRLGDVVVNGSGVFQYDFGKKHQESPYEYKTVPNSPPAALLTALAGLQSRYRRRGHKLEKQIDDALERNPRLKKEYGMPEPSTDILFKSDAIHSDCRDGSCDLTATDAETLVQREPRSKDDGDMLQIHYGLIATGNSVVKDASFRDKLAEEHGVLCFEMEAGGLVDSLPCLVIRGICDYSDSHKNKQWQGYAAMTAAAYAKDVLMEVHPSRVQSGIRLSKILRDMQDKTNEMHQSVRGVMSYVENHAGEKYLEWLSTMTFGNQHSDIIKSRAPDTGQWFLKTAEYRFWLSENQQTLFCPGIPGAGKTMIMSIVISDLISRYHDDKSVAIAFVYCNYRLQENQDLETLLASLLRQVANRCSSVPKPVKELYDRHESYKTRPSCEELKLSLHEVIGSFRRVYIVIDALDEYQSNGRQVDLIKALSELQRDVAINFIVTSRHVPEIKAEFEAWPCLKISAATEDLEAYIKESNHKFPNDIQQDEKLQCDIRTQLIDICQEMFLLMKLYADSLFEKTSKREVRDTLKSLPRLKHKAGTVSSTNEESSVLNEAYSGILERIKAQSPSHVSLALKVLRWVIFAKTQLDVRDFEVAVGTIVGDRVFDMDNLRDVDTLISPCCGLVVLDKKSGVVRLVHYTTLDYLVQNKSTWAPTAQRDMASDCITHLMYDYPGLATDPPLKAIVWRTTKAQGSHNDSVTRLMRNLHTYSAQYWGYHVAESEGEVGGVREFWQDEWAVHRAGLRLAFSRLRGFPWSYDPPGFSSSHFFTTLHLLAYFGLDDLLDMELLRVANHSKYPSPIAIYPSGDGKSRSYLTPVQIAISAGHTSTVEKLVKLGMSKEPVSPLTYAASKGSTKMVKTLIQCGVDVNQRSGETQQTALMFLAQRWPHFPKIMEILIENNADLFSIDEFGRSSLFYAAKNHKVSEIQLLLEAGVDVNATDKDGMTPLLFTCDDYFGSQSKKTKIIRLLVSHGADFRKVNHKGHTALSIAVAGGKVRVMKLLLIMGAGTNMTTKDEENALILALYTMPSFYWSGHLASHVSEYCFNSEYIRRRRQEALSKASLDANPVISQRFLDSGANVNGKDSQGRTPLMSACLSDWESTMSVLKLLIDRGACIQDVDSDGKSALAYAVGNGYLERAAISLLIEAGANVHQKDHLGMTPLMHACKQWTNGVSVNILLENGAKIDDVDTSGRSVLAHAIASGHIGIVKLLIYASADINGRDFSEEMPPSVARQVHFDGSDEIIQILDSKSVALNTTPKVLALDIINDAETNSAETNVIGSSVMQNNLCSGNKTDAARCMRQPKVVDWIRHKITQAM